MIGGAVLLPLALAIAVLVAWGPGSPSGFAYAVGLLLLSIGLVTKPWRRERRRFVARGGAALIVLTALVRLAHVGAKEPEVGLLTLPEVRPGRWLDRLVNEQDPVLAGARLYALKNSEARGLPEALRTLYGQMARDRGTTPSPLAGTFLLSQTPEAFDTIVIPARKRSSAAVLFLHGFAGSFTIQCWQMARAAAAIGALTACPATDWRGQWWNKNGEQIVAEALHFLEERGVTRIYLAGLSNGAVGASELPGVFAQRLAGVVLVSGGSKRPRLRDLPALVVQGTEDGMMPVALARSVAASDPHAQLVTFPGDHFLFAESAPAVEATISKWLVAQEARQK